MRDNVRQHLKDNSEKNYDKVRLEMLSMMSVEERAKAFADRHQEAELELRGLGATYGYQRIYNAEIGAYERGAIEQMKIDIDKACEFILESGHIRIGGISRREFVEYFRKAMEE